MNIKEVEKEVGIRKANIRYYEEQGLIIPSRNLENNYRNYSEEDVLCLKKIKLLRLLGISVSEIKQIQDKQATLSEIVVCRISDIDEEIAGLKEIKELCLIFLECNQSYDTMDISLLSMRESSSLLKGTVFMKVDKCRNYKSIYQKMSQVLLFFCLLFVFPNSQNVQDFLHYSMPEWMNWISGFGVAILGNLTAIALIFMLWEQKKEREKMDQINLEYKKDKLFKGCH